METLTASTVTDMLIVYIRNQTELLIQLSSAVVIGAIATMARYFLPTGVRTEVQLPSFLWLFGAIAASGLSAYFGFMIYTYLTGHYYEAALRIQSNLVCKESLNYFACDTGVVLKLLAGRQKNLCSAGVGLLVLWYAILLWRVRKGNGVAG